MEKVRATEDSFSTLRTDMSLGGETIKEMQSATGCRINVSSQSHPSDPDREISLQGNPDAISRARQAIEDKVDEAVRITRILSFVDILKSFKQRNRNNNNNSNNRNDRGSRNDNYGGDRYQQNSYQQQQPSSMGAGANMLGMSSAVAGVTGMQPGTDSAADPYAPYGGYQVS